MLAARGGGGRLSRQSMDSRLPFVMDGRDDTSVNPAIHPVAQALLRQSLGTNGADSNSDLGVKANKYE